MYIGLVFYIYHRIFSNSDVVYSWFSHIWFVVKVEWEGIMSKRDLTNIPPGNRECSVCGEEKPNIEYQWYLNRFTKDGYRLRVNTNCSTCSKRISKELGVLRRKLLKTHPKPLYGEPCDLCGKPVDRNWQLDHCHETGKFRGWLCKGCNTGLGGIGDSFDSALNALIYLGKFKEFNSEQLKELIEERMVNKK